MKYYSRNQIWNKNVPYIIEGYNLRVMARSEKQACIKAGKILGKSPFDLWVKPDYKGIENLEKMEGNHVN